MLVQRGDPHFHDCCRRQTCRRKTYDVSKGIEGSSSSTKTVDWNSIKPKQRTRQDPHDNMKYTAVSVKCCSSKKRGGQRESNVLSDLAADAVPSAVVAGETHLQLYPV